MNKTTVINNSVNLPKVAKVLVTYKTDANGVAMLASDLEAVQSKQFNFTR
jgi:hypothetical protein